MNNMNNMNNNNNNNNPNNVTFTSSSPNDKQFLPFRIATHNVQGLNSYTKQQQLLEFVHLNKIDIMGLSETKLSRINSRYIMRNSSQFVQFFNNDSDTPNGSGVGILISKDYAKYVHTCKGFKGRVIYIDLFMKGRVKIRVIQIYLHATTSNNRKNIEEIYKYIYDLLDFSRKNNYKVILMGDFNIDYAKYKQEYRRKGSFNWVMEIYHKLKVIYQMKDTVKLYNDITPSSPH